MKILDTRNAKVVVMASNSFLVGGELHTQDEYLSRIKSGVYIPCEEVEVKSDLLSRTQLVPLAAMAMLDVINATQPLVRLISKVMEKGVQITFGGSNSVYGEFEGREFMVEGEDFVEVLSQVLEGLGV